MRYVTNGWMVLAVAVAGLLAGCSGSGGADNVAACEAYVQNINSLDCFEGAAMLDEGSTCSRYDETDCDIADYFDCLTTTRSAWTWLARASPTRRGPRAA